jgi:hypothetical protein
MRRIVILFSLFAGILVLQGCSAFYYAPNAHFVHFLKAEEEMSISGKAGFAHYELFSAVNEFQFDAGYGMDKKHMWTAGATAIPIPGGGIFATELGFGRYGFEPLAADSLQGLIYNFSGGLGLGAGQAFGITGGIIRPYGMAMAGYSSRYFNAGLSLRAGYIDYFGLKGTNEPDITRLALYGKDLKIEPAFTVEAGFETIKLQAQGGLSYGFSRLPQAHAYMSLGLGVMINSLVSRRAEIK